MIIFAGPLRVVPFSSAIRVPFQMLATPVLQDIVCRKWSKADELAKLKLECKELQRKIDENLKEAERSHTLPETTSAEYEPKAA